ncbi:hypothetical protein [Thiorhodovibrio frisius]|uniref:hypothetical protein n=1 Tax=Thiorhodovibrio frisius TaxID=631362 RepID=UPI00022C6EE3|nr:hypothetical protein [Thiorhodovibrio frisius]WPL22796.1 hypothetical protein Thiofri_02970 [Thiorhodovibrio frisius]
MNSKPDTEPEDDMEDEYDFAAMEGGIQGKYAGEFNGTTTAIVLDSDVAQVLSDQADSLQQ